MVFSLEAYLGYLTRVDPDKLRSAVRKRRGELCFSYGPSGKITINEDEIIHIPDGRRWTAQRIRGYGLGSRAYLFFCVGYCNVPFDKLRASNDNRKMLEAGRELREFFV